MELIEKLIDNAVEIHRLNVQSVIVIIAFIRSPDLKCILKIIQDFGNVSSISPTFTKTIKTSKNKQYFIIDNKKIYLKHKVI